MKNRIIEIVGLTASKSCPTTKLEVVFHQDGAIDYKMFNTDGSLRGEGMLRTAGDVEFNIAENPLEEKWLKLVIE